MKLYIVIIFLAIIQTAFSQTVVISEIVTSNSKGIHDEDNDKPDWIEIYNPSEKAVNLHGYGLSDKASTPDKWLFPDRIILPRKCMVIFASGKNRLNSILHTNFKLSVSGETLVFSNSTGVLLEKITVPALPSNISYGRKADGSGGFYYFYQPTPGILNNTTPYSQLTGDPVFSLQGGIYQEPATLKLWTSSLSDTIYYTLDGSEPSKASPVFPDSLIIKKTSVIRAKVLSNNTPPSRTITETYFISPPPSRLPIVSLSTAPANLWSAQTGIYAMGNNASKDYPNFGANFWQDWERPVNFQMHESGNTATINNDCGIQINGAYSRAYPQKSFALFARGEYGASAFSAPLFPSNSNNEFQSVILRNGGNDFYGTLLRDRFVNLIAAKLGIGAQATRFCHVFLNAEYWGIYTLKEKINEHFLAANYNIDPDKVDLLENNLAIHSGHNVKFFELRNFISKNDISLPANYDKVKNAIDIKNFIDYNAAQIFINNTDWPGNNIKYWCSQSDTAKWRWLIYDTDYGFGFTKGQNTPGDFVFNTLEFATATDGPSWPNPEWSTVILRKLLENADFRNEFSVTFAHLLNTVFRRDTLSSIFAAVKAEIKDDIKRHLSRWSGTIGDWESNCTIISNFIQKRGAYMSIHLLKQFNATAMPQLTLNISDTAAGFITLQDNSISSFPFTGRYLNNSVVRLKAVPRPGFRFVRWEGGSKSDAGQISVPLSADQSRTAVFEKSSTSAGIEPALNRPDIFRLMNNYPNPFNPSTVISFDLAEKTFVRLAISDILGREIAVLVNGDTYGGLHRVVFNAAGLTSGIYFIRLQAGGKTEVRKCILAR